MLKIRLFALLFCVLSLSIFSIENVSAQTDSTTKLTRLLLETRMEFDYTNQVEKEVNNFGYITKWDENLYGFRGRYLNFKLSGDLGKNFSYNYVQRIIPAPGNTSFFDNTDFLTLSYRPTQHWTLTFGKQALYVGSFEYDAAPINEYYCTQFWNSIACFQLGFDVKFTDKQGKNSIALQMTNSPYIYQEATWQNRFFGVGLFAYNLAWFGNYTHFKTIYSINMLERQRGDFIAYIGLGNQLQYDRWSIYLDYVNRVVSAASAKDFFSDFTVVTRADIYIDKGFSLMVKGGYEQNLSEWVHTLDVRDIMVTPGHQYAFAGVGMEFRPVKYQDVRVHAYVQYNSDIANNLNTHIESTSLNAWNANVGITWTLNFLRLIQKHRVAKSI